MNIVLFEGEPFFARNDDRYLHIKKILKKGVGDTFSAGIIDESEGIATITALDETGLAFAFRAERPCRALWPIAMLIGFPRPIQLKRLLRDVASLGASGVYLCGTDLGERSYRESALADRDAVRAALVEGCVQAGSSSVPGVGLFASVDEALASLSPAYGRRVVLDTSAPGACLIDAASLSSVSARDPLLLAIGSERGWTARERALFGDAGFEARGLGSRILRTETAATAALSIALAKSGFMGGPE